MPGSGPRTNGRGGSSSGHLTTPLTSLLDAARHTLRLRSARYVGVSSASVSCLSIKSNQIKLFVLNRCTEALLSFANPLTGGTRPNFSRIARMAVLVLNHDLNNHTQLVLEYFGMENSFLKSISCDSDEISLVLVHQRVPSTGRKSPTRDAK